MDGVTAKASEDGAVMGGMPPETPGDLPPQNLHGFDVASRR